MRIGSYEVEGELGRGGMGVVLRARSANGDVVAVKVLHRADAKDALDRFEREGRLLEALGEAEGFVPLIERGDSPQGPFLVMPFVPGGTLQDRLRRGALGIEETIALGRSLARALGVAHAKGIVHRDLKPANILFAADGRPLIADLGLAKHWRKDAPGASRSVELSRTGTARGTVGYMAPEQFQSARSVGPTADVFSLGSILFECLAGAPAFPGETALEICTRIASDERPSLASARPDAPPWLVSVISRSLALRPEGRFANGAALDSALSSPSTRPTALVLVLVLVLVLALTALNALPARSSPPPPPPPAAPIDSWTSALPSLPATKRLRVSGVFSDPAWSTTFASHLAWVPGTPLVLAGSEEAIFVVDTRDGSIARHLVGHRGDLGALTASPDGKLVASSSLGRPPPPQGRFVCEEGLPSHVRIWDLATGASRTIVEGPFTALAFTQDGTRLVLGGMTGTVSVFDVKSGEQLASFPASDQPIRRLATGRDRAVVAAREVGLHRLETGERICRLEVDASFVSLREGGAQAFVGGRGGDLEVFDLASEVEFQRVRVGPVAAAVLLADEKRVLVGHPEGELEVVTLETGARRPLTAPHIAHYGYHGKVTAVAASSDGKRAVTAGWDGRLRLWDLDKGTLLAPLDDQPTWVSKLAISDGGLIASSSRDGHVRIWDGDTGARVRTSYASLGELWSLGLSRDGETLFTAGWSGELGVFDVTAGQWVVKKPCGSQVFGVGLSADGRIALAQQRDGRTTVWDIEKGAAELPHLPGSALWSRRVAVLSKGRAIAPADGKTLALWDLAARKTLRTFRGGTSELMDLDVARDESRLVAVGTDLVGRVYDLRGEETGDVEPIATLRGHETKVTGCALSPDGKLAVTASEDRTIRLWDAKDAFMLDKLDFTPLADRPWSVAFSADGRWFAAGTDRGYVLRIEVR